jgi:hypothetical protein
LRLLILLRLAGQRTLAKWYAFDLIDTVALGSTFANSVLTNNITVAQSLVGFVILVGLQFAIAFMVVRWSYLRIIINPQPTLVLHCGKFVQDAMRRQRVAKPMCEPRSAKEALIAVTKLEGDPGSRRHIQRHQAARTRRHWPISRVGRFNPH